MQPHLTRARHRSYKTELNPSRIQVDSFIRHAGCARFIYNWGLAKRIDSYKKTGKTIGFTEMCADMTILKRTDCPWLCEVSHAELQQSLRNLDRAYADFFRRCKKGGKHGHPRYKSKRKGLGSFMFNRNMHVEQGRIKLPTIGWVHLKEREYIDGEGGRLLSCTVSEKAGRWFASVQYEEQIPIPIHNSEVVGVDLGCNNLATLSNGAVVENPKALRRNIRQLKKAQRSLSRKQKGSANRQKARLRLAVVHHRVANVRKDSLHQATSAIAKRYGVVVMEDLNVEGMKRNRKLARTISDVGMYEFKRQMAYKLDWAGGTLILANRFFPSSKNCSGCGAYKGDLALADRTYRCDSCGLVIDRDLNAARNLAMVAGKSPETLNACGGHVRLESFEQRPLKQEPAYTRETGSWED